MMAAIWALISPRLSEIILSAGGAIAALGTLLLARKMGKDAAKAQAAQEDAEHADTIRKAGADARAHADAAPADGLHDDDGFKRR